MLAPQGARAPNSRKCESYNVNDWRSKSVVRVTFWRDMYVGTGTRCALRLLFTIFTTWHLWLLYDRKCYITLTKWIYPQIWERCRPADVSPVLFYCWPTVCNDDPTLATIYSVIPTLKQYRVTASCLQVSLPYIASTSACAPSKTYDRCLKKSANCLLLVLFKNISNISVIQSLIFIILMGINQNLSAWSICDRLVTATPSFCLHNYRTLLKKHL